MIPTAAPPTEAEAAAPSRTSPSEHDVNEELWQTISTLYTYDGGMRETFAMGLPSTLR